MKIRWPNNPIMGISSAIILFGSLAMVKLFQDNRYFQHDSKRISMDQNANRDVDVEKLKRKYNISDEDVRDFEKRKNLRKVAPPTNDVEADPAWENRRAPRKFNM